MNNNNNPAQIILASASPRRRELLDQLGISYEAQPVDADETPKPGEAPEAFVERLALEKACAGFLKCDRRLPALGSDTIVIAGERILGKPRDRDDAIDMLKLLSGETHQVFTAVAMANAEKTRCLMSRSKVSFRTLKDSEIEAYWNSGEPADKAGAYAIQGKAAQFIKRLDGSYSGVMGLPLYETAELLKEFGITLLD